MESSEQERPMESRPRPGTTTPGQAGDQNAVLVNLLHALMVIAIVGLIVGYIVIQA
jgi:hypothetical protein